MSIQMCRTLTVGLLLRILGVGLDRSFAVFLVG
jgi:hypothetical protein